MGTTLIVNPGSSSKKYALFVDDVCALQVRFEQTGNGYEVCTAINASQQKCEGIDATQFTHAFDALITIAIRENVVQSANDIECVAIRIVAPGTFFQQHRKIDAPFLEKLLSAESSAPLHTPAVRAEIELLQKKLSHAAFYALSDSAFHAAMPKHTRSYAIPEEDATTCDVFRFGYHGISLASVCARAPEVFGSMPKRMIVCHIGSGVSVTAVKDGVSIDTTMGYAPGSGLIMGTRAGDVDSGALLELMRKKHMRVQDAELYLQTQGGIRALFGENDLRLVLDGIARKDEKARTAFDHFAYHIRKTVGAYTVALGGLDALVLTATASERNPHFRMLLLQGLDALGIEINNEKNEACIGRTSVISASGSKVNVAVIPTDEIGQMYTLLSHLAR